MLRRYAKKSAVTVVGFGLIAVGVVMMPLPGPGSLIVVAGVAVLATEYAWARRTLESTGRQAIKHHRRAATNTWMFVVQLLFAAGLIGVAIAFLAWPNFIFANPVTATMLTISGVVLGTSAVLTRRYYLGREI